MRLKTPVFLLLAVAVLVSSGLAQAQSNNPAVTDLGNNVYMVDGRKGAIPNLLPGEEVQKIATLQSAPLGAVLLSPVSSDDQTVLAATNELFFLNIHDGSTIKVRRQISGLKRGFSDISNLFWLDDNRVGLYGLDTATDEIALVAFDRRTGAGAVVQSSDDLTKLPFFVSPYGRKVMVVSIPDTAFEDTDTALTVRLPGSDGITSDSRHQALSRAGLSQEPPAGSRARALVGLAELFAPHGVPVAAMAIEPDIAVVDTETGEARMVTTLKTGSAPRSFNFSQNGDKFAITVDGVNLDPPRGRDGALFSEQIYRDVTGNLAPDKNPWIERNQLITLDFPSGEVQTLQGKADALYTSASWSTDNQSLAVRVQTPGRLVGRRYPIYSPQYRSGSYLSILNSAFQEQRRLARNEVSYLNLQADFISPDEVLIQSQNQLNYHPFYYNWRTGEFRDIADRPGAFAPVVATRFSRELVFAYSSFTDPVDLYRMSWEGRAFARLTWASEAVRQVSQTKQYPVSFTLGNRSTHTGVLILPANVSFPPKRMPIVVWQEGGPTAEVINTWAAVVESPFGLLPSFGFGLLVVPLYGRYGLGPSRFNALADGNNFGQIDIDAQAEIVAQMRARGWASKVGIVGCSYGGYFTTQSITRHPSTYDAAHSMCTLVDLITEWNRGFSSLAPWMAGLPPTAALDEYRRDSPLYNANRVRTPLLAFHGTDDFLPVTLMENFMLQVINNKVPAKLLKFRDAEHSFFNQTPRSLTPIYELYGAQEQLIWFRTYLR